MFTALMFEEGKADLSTSHENLVITYIRCQPPARLKPKGTVVLLHGLLQTNYQFRHVIDLFSMGGYVIVAPNLLGNRGCSSNLPERSMSRSRLCQDLAQFLSHLQIQRPVNLIGHGLGAEIVIHFAFTYPEMLQSIVWSEALPLNGQSPLHTELVLESDAGIWHEIESSNKPSQVSDVLSRFRGFIKQGSSKPLTFSDDDIAEYVDSYSELHTAQKSLDLQNSAWRDSIRLRDLLISKGKCKIPSLLLVGEQSEMRSVARKSMNQLFSESSSPGMTVIEDCKSFGVEEQPESYALRALAFLNSMTETSPPRQVSRAPQLTSTSIPPRL